MILNRVYYSILPNSHFSAISTNMNNNKNNNYKKKTYGYIDVYLLP